MKTKLLESPAVSYSLMLLTIIMIALAFCNTAQGQGAETTHSTNDTMCAKTITSLYNGNIQLKHEMSLMRTDLQQEKNTNIFLTEKLKWEQRKQTRNTVCAFLAIFSTAGLIFMTTTLQNQH